MCFPAFPTTCHLLGKRDRECSGWGQAAWTVLALHGSISEVQKGAYDLGR